MDLAFGIEALALEWLTASPEPAISTKPTVVTGILATGKQGAAALEPGVHRVPADIDAAAARLVLAALGVRLDTLTEAQRTYLASWRLGS
jgi:S-adenosylhomocysteine hydrolase